MTQHFLPPEWSPQSGVMLTWPNAGNTWQPSLVANEKIFVEIAKTIARFEKVLISCSSAEHLDHVAQLLAPKSDNIKLYMVPAHDVWARDHGPITILHNHQPKLIDFVFNGWGNKYSAELDNQITQHLYYQNAFGHTPIESSFLVLEGGSIEVDGAGTLLTTSRCLLAPTRNANFDREQITVKLQHYFGVSKILWLDHGYMAGDDTDGHIDTLARFVDPYTICYVSCDDPTDEHYDELSKMAEQLNTFTNSKGEAYKLIPLPWPQAKYSEDGTRLPATYANFLIINQAVLVPTYDDPADAEALKVLQQCFPDRQIMGIACRDLIEQFGSLHCVTMQLPAGVL